MNDYSDYPVSITEMKSDITGDAKDWTPRDVLISLLREIDSGQLDISAVVVAFRAVSDGNPVQYRVASPDPILTLGLLERVKNRLMNNT